MKDKNMRPVSPMRTIKRLFSYFRYNKKTLVFGLFLTIVSTIVQVLVNGMYSPVIDALAMDHDFAAFVRFLLIMGVGMLIVVITQYVGARIMAILAQDTVLIVRRELSEKLVNMPISFYDQHTHGELMSTFTNDVDLLVMCLEQSITQLATALFTLLGTFIMMLIISVRLTMIVLVFLVVALFLTQLIARTSGRFYVRRQTMTADLNGYVEEMIGAQKVIKVFNREEQSIAEFDARAEELRHVSTRASTFGVMIMPVMGNLTYLMYAVVAYFGSLLVIAKTLTIGNIAAFLQYTRAVSNPIIGVANQLNSIFAAIAGAERIFRILDIENEHMEGDVTLVKEGEESYWLVPGENNQMERIPVKGDVRFFDVDFGYDANRMVLKNISLYAKPNQKIAFVGSTGAGKTTITNLINRFYEINRGKITLDGIDLRRIDKTALRSLMSVVLQDVNLFNGTIAENIRYGRLDATDEEVVEAAMAANAHPFISKLEKGYETEITSSGGGLSQGEQQLLSIARAAIAQPRILIMDEATSSVDTRTEKMIAAGMDALMEGRTTFVIAHRLSTVRDADAIIVLEHGKIIERGSHEELMNLHGRYYDLNVGKAELS